MTTIKSFKALRSAGGIVSHEPVKRHIEWTTVDPESGEDVTYDADVWMLKQGAGSMLQVSEEKTKEQITFALSKSVLLENDKGKLELISYDDAFQLDPPLRRALWAEFEKFSGLGRKNLVPMTNSSATSSSTESAEEQSQSAESASPTTST